MDNGKVLQAIRKSIDSNPKDFNAYQDYFDMLRNLSDKAESFEHNLWLRKQTADMVAHQLTDASQIAKFFELNKKTYLYMAKDDFHSYCIYLEWAREPSKRFYLPRVSVIRPIVQDMQDLIDDKLDLLAISLCPGSGKSTLEIFLHSWLVGRNPAKPNLASGHSGMLTNSIYDGVCSILQDPTEYLWHDVFPEAGKIITNAKEQTIDVGKKHRFSSLTCRAINATLTGATRCEGLLTADDLVSGIEEAMSKERLDKLWIEYTNDLKSRKKLGAKELHISTRWSVHDVIGRLERQQEHNDRAKFVVIPALNEQGESNFNYKYGVGFDKAFFEDMKDSLDDASFRALYMNEPIEREGQLYHPDELRRYFTLPDREPDAIIGVCDTKDKGSDYAFLPVGYVYGNDHYIADCIYDNGKSEFIDVRLIELLHKHKVKMCRFESNSAGGRVAKDIQEGIRQKNGITNITTKFTTANKETKIIVNSAWVKANCLFLDETMYTKASDYGKMLRDLCSYSMMGKNKHDDAPDGMAMYAEYAQSFMGNKVEVINRAW